MNDCLCVGTCVFVGGCLCMYTCVCIWKLKVILGMILHQISILFIKAVFLNQTHNSPIWLVFLVSLLWHPISTFWGSRTSRLPHPSDIDLHPRNPHSNIHASQKSTLTSKSSPQSLWKSLCVYVYVHTYVCVGMCMLWRTDVHAMCQFWALSPYFLRQGSHFTWNSSCGKAGWPLHCRDPPVFSTTLELQIQAARPHFYLGVGDINSGPLSCTVSILPTEPSFPSHYISLEVIFISFSGLC